MGLLTEYIKALSEGLKHPLNVINGWINDAKLQNGTLSEDETVEILRRRAICNTCPFMSKNAIANGNYVSSRNDEHCIHCKCPITKKTASLQERCGIEIYNSIVKNNPIPLKWDIYVKQK